MHDRQRRHFRQERPRPGRPRHPQRRQQLTCQFGAFRQVCRRQRGQTEHGEPRRQLRNFRQLAVQTTRSAQGVAVMSLKRKAVVESAAELEKTLISNVGRYLARALPAAGALVRPEDIGETQMKLDI